MSEKNMELGNLVLSTSTSPSLDSQLSAVHVIIPAQNEEDSLPLVLQDLPPVGRVIVVDNDSNDETARVAIANGAEVVDEPRRGYGSACLAGMHAIETATAQGTSAPEFIVFLDGDYGGSCSGDDYW